MVVGFMVFSEILSFVIFFFQDFSKFDSIFDSEFD